MSNGNTREGTDAFGKYWEKETSKGNWAKFKRENNGISYMVIGSKTDDYVNSILANGTTLQLNDMSDRVEIEGLGPITDVLEAVILNTLTDCDMKGDTKMRRALLELAHRNKYHPVKRYLDALPEWDGQDHFAALMNKMEMTSQLAEVFWRKFLIGSIAKTIDAKQNFMLVLVGAQGKGKSRLVNWLCPIRKLFNEGPINPENKDDLIMLIEKWFWEVAELDATTRKASRSALKHFVSRERVVVRVPFGKYAIDKPASASMIGTVNEDGTGFLNDPSGNRRFGVVNMVDIDWSYETDINLTQLWAQIYAAYKSGEAYELTYQEKEIQNEINLTYTMSTPLEELFLAYMEHDKSQPEKFMSSMDILNALQNVGLEGKQYQNKIELAALMVKLGLEPSRKMINGKRVRGYAGVWLETVNISNL